MSLTTDLTEQEEVEYETVTGIHWEISPSDKVDLVPDGTNSIDFANGYTKGKADMSTKIEAAIAEIINKAMESTTYVACGLYEATDIIRKHTGEAE